MNIIAEVLLFLQGNYFLVVYGIALILSVVQYKYYFDTHLKALPIIIGYILLTEILGYIILDFEEIQLIFREGYSYYNHLIYNILDIVLFVYFSLIYKKSIINRSFKKLINYGIIGFLTVSIINVFFQDFTLYPQFGSMIYGSLMLLLGAFVYLKDSFGKSALSSNYRKLLRWISFGIIIFHPFYPVIIITGQLNESLFHDLHLRLLLILLITAMFSCFSIGFLKMRKI